MSRWPIIATIFFLSVFLVNLFGEWLRGQPGKNRDRASAMGALVFGIALIILQTAIGGHTAVGKTLLEWLREVPDGDLFVALAPLVGCFAQMFLIQGAALLSGFYRPTRGARMVGAVVAASLTTTIFVFLMRAISENVSDQTTRLAIGGVVSIVLFVFFLIDLES